MQMDEIEDSDGDVGDGGSEPAATRDRARILRLYLQKVFRSGSRIQSTEKGRTASRLAGGPRCRPRMRTPAA